MGAPVAPHSMYPGALTAGKRRFSAYICIGHNDGLSVLLVCHATTLEGDSMGAQAKSGLNLSRYAP